jgi:hypothetical protein
VSTYQLTETNIPFNRPYLTGRELINIAEAHMNGKLLKLNPKPIQRSLPVPNRHVPFLANISQHQVEKFTQRLIAWKRSTVLCNLAQAHVHRLNGIDRVNHFANLRWIVKERNDAL